MPENLAQGAATVGIWAGVLGIVTLIIRQIGPWRKQLTEIEARIREELRGDLQREREAHALELRSFTLERDEMADRIARLEDRLARQRSRHEAERALDRHRLNNINQCFDAMLLLLKANPEQPQAAIKLVEEMRAKQLVAEAEEKAIILAAEMATSPVADDAPEPTE